MNDVVVMTGILPDKAVTFGQLIPITPPFEDIGARNTFHGEIPLGDRCLDTVVELGPHYRLLPLRVSSQHGERIVMSRFNDFA